MPSEKQYSNQELIEAISEVVNKHSAILSEQERSCFEQIRETLIEIKQKQEDANFQMTTQYRLTLLRLIAEIIRIFTNFDL